MAPAETPSPRSRSSHHVYLNLSLDAYAILVRLVEETGARPGAIVGHVLFDYQGRREQLELARFRASNGAPKPSA